MAKTIATITGTALKPGVSKNGRWYKPEHVAAAVVAAQKRLAAGEKPMVMLTFHGADDNSREIAASLRSMSLTEAGAADFAADFADTPAGWDIAKLTDISDGKPAHLKNVSIRGAWTGQVRRERGPDGRMVETADGVELEGIDFTKAPGVDGAEIKTFAWATDGQNETSERVLIAESVEGTVSVTEETTPGPPEGVREALAAFLGESGHHVLDNGECVTCAAPSEAKDPKKPYGDVQYADPGYQSDGKKRYPLDSSAHVRSAWSYVNQAKNGAKYTSQQLKRVKGRIKAAMKSIGAKVSTETAGWVVSDPRQVTEAIAEWYGDPATKGSWSISASNGPVNLSLSSWSMDPADLSVILRAAADAACSALVKLDPDMDGDIDVPGVGDNTDTDQDGGHESAPDDPAVTEDGSGGTSAEADTDPADAGTQEGDPAMGDQASTETGGAAPAGLSPEIAAMIGEAVKAGVAEGIKAAVPAPPATETAPAAPAATEGTKETAVAETGTDARVAALVAEQLKAAGIKVPEPVSEADAEKARIDAAVAEALKAAGVAPKTEVTEAERIQAAVTEQIQNLVSDGSISVHRAGVVVEHSAPDPDHALGAKDLAAMDEDTFVDTYAGPALDKHVASRTRITAVHT